MFTTDERHLLAAASARPDDEGPRQVLADLLLEREHPLGELLRLEAEDRSLSRRRTLEASLRDTLRTSLVPWAKELELDRGLPSWALFAPGMRVLRPEDDDAPWPVTAVSVVGEFREVLPLLRSRAVRRLHTLDFSPVWATSPYTRWVDGPPPPLEPLPELRELALPQGDVPDHWVPILTPGFANVRVIAAGIGPGSGLPDWALSLPSLERLRLLPGREPGDGDVVTSALAWGDKRGGNAVEWLGRLLAADDARRELRPALPGAQVALPEESHLEVDLVPDTPDSRVFHVKGSDALLLRAEDAPAIDVFAAPRRPSLVAPKRLVRVRRALFVDLEDAGAPSRLEQVPVPVALHRTREFVHALQEWWGTGAPDVPNGSWVGLGRDQLRLRADGSLAVIPALTRRLGPDAHQLLEVVGVPLAWERTTPMIVRLAAATMFEWLTGVSFLESHVGSAIAVHQRLRLRLAHAPSVSDAQEGAARFDDLLQTAISTPHHLSVDDFVRALVDPQRG
jgi:uncharacterized protein (TIGR02996 family)